MKPKPLNESMQNRFWATGARNSNRYSSPVSTTANSHLTRFISINKIWILAALSNFELSRFFSVYEQLDIKRELAILELKCCATHTQAPVRFDAHLCAWQLLVVLGLVQNILKSSKESPLRRPATWQMAFEHCNNINQAFCAAQEKLLVVVDPSSLTHAVPQLTAMRMLGNPRYSGCK